VYDFVTNPVNWTKTYSTSTQIGGLPEEPPLKVGDTWYEGGPDGQSRQDRRLPRRHRAGAGGVMQRSPQRRAL
jgi:hypothetical protein